MPCSEYNIAPVFESEDADHVGYVSSHLSSLGLDPPSFRFASSSFLSRPHRMYARSLYDASTPIIFPSGPVTLHQLLPRAQAAAKTRLAETLTSLRIRGHSLPLLCPPLVLLACPGLRSFSMTGNNLCRWQLT